MNNKNIIGSLSFSFTDEFGENTSLQKTFSEDCEDIGKIFWLLNEFKYFLHAMSFSESMTNKIIYLEKGEKVIDEDGKVIAEG